MACLHLSRLHLYAFILYLIALAIQHSWANSVEAINEPVHVVWFNKQQSRIDLIFDLVEPIRNNTKLSSVAPSSLVYCVGYSACILQDGKLRNNYNLVQTNSSSALKNVRESRFISVDQKPSSNISPKPSNSSLSSSTKKCNQSLISVRHRCSTHWSPPMHIIGDGCKESLEWFSPSTCPVETINYQRPCYTHDSDGKLIDLTPWVLSNGSSYLVDTNSFNESVKKFHLNICNEAHDSCGPNVVACYIGKHGFVESGFNNRTSLEYDAKNKTTTLTSLGQFNASCPENSVRTIVKFICKDRIFVHPWPKLISNTPCESIIEWTTIHACAQPEITVPATKCSISNQALGLNIDLKDLTHGLTNVTIPGITYNGKSYNMVFGLCNGINSTSIECEGKSRSTTSACLINANATAETISKNSRIIGSLIESNIRLTDNRLLLESFHPDQTCQIPINKGFNVTRQVGARIEFFCSVASQKRPVYRSYEECIHVFEWGSPLLCFEDGEDGEIGVTESEIQSGATSSTFSHSIIEPPNLTTPTRQSKSDAYKNPKTTSDMHQETLKDMNKTLSIDDKQSLGNQSKVIVHDITSAPEVNIQPSASNKAQPTDVASENNDVKIVAPVKPPTERMNSLHKFFMIGLIVMSLAAFIVIIFILDKKTQFRIPLGNVRRQARQVFQPQQVPYSRVDRFNDFLDL